MVWAKPACRSPFRFWPHLGTRQGGAEDLLRFRKRGHSAEGPPSQPLSWPLPVPRGTRGPSERLATPGRPERSSSLHWNPVWKLENRPVLCIGLCLSAEEVVWRPQTMAPTERISPCAPFTQLRVLFPGSQAAIRSLQKHLFKGTENAGPWRKWMFLGGIYSGFIGFW